MDTHGCHIAKNSNIQIDQDAGNITAKDAFHPQKLAEHANALANGLALKPPGSARPPDTILMEQQRFRTMGASAVQDWTLRVNMLEAML
jgi:cruciform cutting endonuclease 1